MIDHRDIGNNEAERKTETRRLIADGVIKPAGYRPGKIYGTLSCASGKRMKNGKPCILPASRTGGDR